MSGLQTYAQYARCQNKDLEFYPDKHVPRHQKYMPTTKTKGLHSTLCHSTTVRRCKSIMQESEYVISTSDLHPVHEQNRIAKFADDTYLIIPSSMRHTTDEELRAVQKWTTVNNLKLNASKSKEMIVARRLQEIERVTEMQILGVILRGDLRASSHVHRVLSLCNGSLPR